MLSDSNWLLELPFLTVKLLRKLTGIRDVPGILGRIFEDGFELMGAAVVSNVFGQVKKLRCKFKIHRD
jgi:hypothetical protein